MLSISGHLVSTAEVESTLLLHPHIAEAAVVCRMLPIKSECLHCFVPLKNNVDQNVKGAINYVPVLYATLRSELCQLIRKRIGPFVVPDRIHVME
ncbi:Acetyl-coenzyme A synthetase [Fasciola gigantica]|uniref:Acetyl-coenzyme A synthetase n=1 Tax=Fasciola gigantica TaxID=46835 RepID=A0A504YMD6_FASGI|nr:Acetyl-coenzyme A synthetase [Fasciola gigantica]